MRKILLLVVVLVLLAAASQASAAMQMADSGTDMMLKAVFNNVWPAGGKNLTLKLFCNNATPADTSTAGTFTECTGGSYAAKTLTNGSWTESQQSGISQVLYADQTWTFSGALTTNGTIYGWFIVDADGNLTCAEAFGTTFTPANNNDQLTVTPKIQMSKGSPN